MLWCVANSNQENLMRKAYDKLDYFVLKILFFGIFLGCFLSVFISNRAGEIVAMTITGLILVLGTIGRVVYVKFQNKRGKNES